MIQIDLSKALVKPLGRYVKPARRVEPDLYWRADVAMIGSQLCVVAEEQYTRYVIVFCGLNNDDFARFPTLFGERFCREAAAICKQAGLLDDQTLIRQLTALWDTQHLQLDPEPMEESAITRLFEKLERRFLHEHRPLPGDGRSAFEFTYPINSRRPKNDPTGDQPSAAEAIGNLCLNLIEARMASETASLVMSKDDNVVRVDFSRQRDYQEY